MASKDAESVIFLNVIYKLQSNTAPNNALMECMVRKEYQDGNTPLQMLFTSLMILQLKKLQAGQSNYHFSQHF